MKYENLGEFTVKSLRVAEESATCDDVTPAVEYYEKNIKPTLQEDKESLILLVLNARMKIVGWNLVSVGGLCEAAAHPREIMRPLLIAAAHSFIIMHNHPSGDSTPSEADRRFTRRINEAAELMQINLRDHIIYADGTKNTFSFRAAGII